MEDATNSIIDLEFKLFDELRMEIASYGDRIRLAAKAIADLDFICSMADVAVKNRYVMPKLVSQYFSF